MKQDMKMHDVMRFPAAVTGTSVAVAVRTVTATVLPDRSPVPEPAPSAPSGGEARQNLLARRPRHVGSCRRHRAGAGNGREER